MAQPDTSAFRLVKEKVDLVDYLTKHLNVELVPDGPGRLAAICPFHDEDTPSFKVEETDEGWKRWHCYGSCDEGGSVIDAAMRSQEFTLPSEALQYLNQLYGLELDIDHESFKRFAENVEKTKAAIEKSRSKLSEKDKRSEQARNYLHQRGLDDRAIEHFQLGINTDITTGGRLTIPLIDKANHPVAVANRALFDGANCQSCGEWVEVDEMVKARHEFQRAKQRDENPPDWRSCPKCGAESSKSKLAWLVGQKPKYRFDEGFVKAQFLYNEHAARKFLNRRSKENDTCEGLFLAEGYGEVWAGWMAGHEAICSYNGAVLSDWQAKEAAILATKADKPVILIPDFDATGLANVDANISKLRAESGHLEIQVVYGIGDLVYKDHLGNEHPCKDLGDVLKHHGVTKVKELLSPVGRWSSAEWQIRQVINKTRDVEIVETDENGDEVIRVEEHEFYSVERQMQIVAGILSRESSRRTSLDHLIPVLSEKWKTTTDAIRQWFYSELSEDNATSYQHMFKTIHDARIEAREFLGNTENVIPLGFKKIDQNMPGGGPRTGQLMMILGKSGTGKTMLATQMLGNMAKRNVRAVFFSLEQAAKSLYTRLVCQQLGISTEEAEELIINAESDPEIEDRLASVNEIYEKMLIVDNVPTDQREAIEMTPARVQAIIQEANLTKFQHEPAQVVIIDHLGILKVDDTAPQDVKRSDVMAPGYIMERMFHVCKATDVMMIVLQQLPKEVPAGKPFSYDAGRGGSKQTDYCDYILQIYRPVQNEELKDEQEKAAVASDYNIILGKNRFGGSTEFRGNMDGRTLRITPKAEIIQPEQDQQRDQPAVGVTAEEEGSTENPEDLTDEEIFGQQPDEINKQIARGEAGKSPEAMERLAKEAEAELPNDNKVLEEQLSAADFLKSVGAKAEDEDDGPVI